MEQVSGADGGGHVQDLLHHLLSVYPLQAHHGRRRGGEALPHPGHGEGGEDRGWDC